MRYSYGAAPGRNVHASPNLAVTVLGVAVVAVIVGIAWFGVGTGSSPEPPTVAPTSAASDASVVVVHVSGAVADPGVVPVSTDARVADVVRLAGGVTSDADLTALNLAASVRDGDHVVVPRLGETSPSPAGGGIDLNRASASELESLPGVGPVLAGRIVAFRDEHGRFSEVEDLLDVPGIGEAKLDQMRGAIAAP